MFVKLFPTFSGHLADKVFDIKPIYQTWLRPSENLASLIAGRGSLKIEMIYQNKELTSLKLNQRLI